MPRLFAVRLPDPAALLPRRPGRLALFAFAALALTACSTADVSAPEASRDLTAALSRDDFPGKLSKIEEFALAQGTFCDDATPLLCDEIVTGFGIGYVIANVAWPPQDQERFYTLDVGGVNARWWVRNGLSPAYPRYKIKGDVIETRLTDGRRRLRISAEVKNTFAFFDNDYFDANDNYLYSDRLLGADFFEYPGVDPAIPDQVPQVADMDVELDLVLPADFVGMPDLVEMYYPEARKPGMEIRVFNLVTRASGRLRSAFDGMPIGTPVDITVHDDHSGALTPTPAYTPPQFTITRAKGGRNDVRGDAVQVEHYERSVDEPSRNGRAANILMRHRRR